MTEFYLFDWILTAMNIVKFYDQNTISISIPNKRYLIFTFFSGDPEKCDSFGNTALHLASAKVPFNFALYFYATFYSKNVPKKLLNLYYTTALYQRSFCLLNMHTFTFQNG